MQGLIAAGMYCCDTNMESHYESVMLPMKRGDTGELRLTATSPSMHRIKKNCFAQQNSDVVATAAKN